MSLRDVLNTIDLLLGMFFVDLSRMKGVVSKIGQKYFLFCADLAKFTKMLKQLWSATLSKSLIFYFPFQGHFSLHSDSLL